MRRILVPVAATTDANGNATITIPLERTGEWRNVKVALSTTAPAEWALSSAGNQVNYGRGRRAVLGPELLEPEDTLVVTVTGGPVKAAISGTASGVAGTSSEIISSYQAAPNTIALDVTANPTAGPTLVVAAGQSASETLAPPAGTLAVRLTWLASSYPISVDVDLLGSTTSPPARYNAGGAGRSPVHGDEPWTIPIEMSVDSTYTLTVLELSGNQGVTVHVSFLTQQAALEVRTQEALAVSALGQSPALWQAPNLVVVSLEKSTTGTIAVRAGAAGQTIRVFGWQLQIDAGGAVGSGAGLAALEDDSLADPAGRVGTVAARADTPAMVTGYHGGVPLTVGAGLRLNVLALGTNMAVRALVGLSQG